MKFLWIMLFIILPVGGLVYVSWHIWQLLPLSPMARRGVVGLFLLSFLFLILNYSGFLEKLPLETASRVYEIGTSFAFILLYLFMLFLLLDVACLTHLIPRTWLQGNWFATSGITALMLVVFVYGNVHYGHKYKKKISLKTEKRISNSPLLKKKKIVLLSDLHLGYHNRRKEFHRWVDRINAEHPDLILIGGDIIDISARPLWEENVADEFHRLTAPVYACLGNHEYYSGTSEAADFYSKAGIVLLRDSVALVDGICVIGRDDRSNVRRKSLSQLLKNADTQGFSILLYHQPYRLEEAAQAKIDFQFSGHTHHGQVWPISWITDAMYEDAYGSLRKGATRYYVSSGMGIWGGKFRIGTRSEYVVLTLSAIGSPQ